MIEEEQIILEMAIGPLAETGEEGAVFCIYCKSIPPQTKLVYTEEIDWKHEQTCPVVRARRILAERGTPLNIYGLDGEFMLWKDVDGVEHWYEYHSWGLETLQVRALQRYSGENKRNMTATFVSVLPLGEEDQTLEKIARDVQRVMGDKSAEQTIREMMHYYGMSEEEVNDDR
jgi:hypothetical protein